MGWIAVGGIHPDREAALSRVMGEIAPTEAEQRAHECSTDGGNPRESSRPGALERTHEHGLGLVVGVVRREDERGVQSRAQREEPAVARLPRGSLSGPGAELEPLDFAPQSEGRGKGCHPLGDRGALRLDPVIRVRHHELAVCRLAPMEEIEEDDGVETAGDGDERRAAGQLQGVEVGAKLGREVHRRES